jgi:hypothetical protein
MLQDQRESKVVEEEIYILNTSTEFQNTEINGVRMEDNPFPEEINEVCRIKKNAFGNIRIPDGVYVIYVMLINLKAAR